jgi:hypothetical protein
VLKSIHVSTKTRTTRVRGWLSRTEARSPELAEPPESRPPATPSSRLTDPAPDTQVVVSEFHQANRGAYLASLEEIGEKWLVRLDATAEPHDWDVLTAWDGRIHDAAGAASSAWEARHNLLNPAPLWLRSRAGLVAWQTRFITERVAFLRNLRDDLEGYW